MGDFIVFAVVAVIVGAAALYVYRAKKRGVKCIGCPAGEGACHCHSGGGHSPCSGCTGCAEGK